MSAVVVTGASTGIGRAVALRLDGLGLRVFAGVRRDEDGQALTEQSSGRLTPLHLDVAAEPTVASAAEQVRSELGDQRLLGIVNNAGIAVAGPVEAIALEDWRRQFEVNVVGVVSMIHRFLPLLREHRARIVNMSSIGGRFAQPFVAPYVASKHALEAVSDALRIELRPWGIQVVLIEPGSIATPIWDKGVRAAEARVSVSKLDVDTLYGRAMEVMRKVSRREAERGLPPQRVADAVVAALLARNPRTRYLVGLDAHALALIRRVLPDRWRDELVFRATGLPKR